MKPIKKRVLLVDNETSPLRELRRAFEVANFGSFRFEVSSVQSVSEYMKVTREKEFDLLVVDIRLQAGEEGIDTVVAFHKRRWPATIIIVYSAFPGLEAVPTCVRAMKLGALDCIDKDSDASVKQVVDAAVRELEAQTSSDDGPTTEWLMQHFDDLQAKHGGRAVAFVGNDVVSSAESVTTLRKNLAHMPCSGTPYIMLVPSQNEAE